MNIYDFIKGHEGYRDDAYWDSHGGVWTVGYGRTGKDVGEGHKTDRDSEDSWVAKRVDNDRNKVIQYMNLNGYQWNDAQIDALTSGVYNMGVGYLDKVTKGGTRDNATIGDKIRLYNKAGGVELPGLVRRRNEEADIFSGKSVGVAPKGTEVPRVTPKVPEETRMSFRDAFKQARQQQGAGGQFTWQGDMYTTDYKEEVPMKRNSGGAIPDLNDPSNVDTVPAILTKGEYVLNKEATALFGPQIEAMNQAGLRQREAENRKVMAGQQRVPAMPGGYNEGAIVDTGGGLTWDSVGNFFRDPLGNIVDTIQGAGEAIVDWGKDTYNKDRELQAEREANSAANEERGSVLFNNKLFTRGEDGTWRDEEGKGTVSVRDMLRYGEEPTPENKVKQQWYQDHKGEFISKGFRQGAIEGAHWLVDMAVKGGTLGHKGLSDSSLKAWTPEAIEEFESKAKEMGYEDAYQAVQEIGNFFGDPLLLVSGGLSGATKAMRLANKLKKTGQSMDPAVAQKIVDDPNINWDNLDDSLKKSNDFQRWRDEKIAAVKANNEQVASDIAGGRSGVTTVKPKTTEVVTDPRTSIPVKPQRTPTEVVTDPRTSLPVKPQRAPTEVVTDPRTSIPVAPQRTPTEVVTDPRANLPVAPQRRPTEVVTDPRTSIPVNPQRTPTEVVTDPRANLPVLPHRAPTEVVTDPRTNIPVRPQRTPTEVVTDPRTNLPVAPQRKPTEVVTDPRTNIPVNPARKPTEVVTDPRTNLPVHPAKRPTEVVTDPRVDIPVAPVRRPTEVVTDPRANLPVYPAKRPTEVVTDPRTNIPVNPARRPTEVVTDPRTNIPVNPVRRPTEVVTDPRTNIPVHPVKSPKGGTTVTGRPDVEIGTLPKSPPPPPKIPKDPRIDFEPAGIPKAPYKPKVVTDPRLTVIPTPSPLPQPTEETVVRPPVKPVVIPDTKPPVKPTVVDNHGFWALSNSPNKYGENYATANSNEKYRGKIPQATLTQHSPGDVIIDPKTGKEMTWNVKVFNRETGEFWRYIPTWKRNEGVSEDVLVYDNTVNDLVRKT